MKHAEQCFGYIRQGIMYSEDTALEGLDGDPKPGESPIQGWSVGNTCRNLGESVSWMAENTS